MAKCYFSHDSNAKDDPKIILLIDQLGLEGYGAFWVLIEILRQQPNYRLPIASIPRISRTYNITQAKLLTVINNYQLFVTDNEYFFSQSLMTRMLEMDKKYSDRTVKGWEVRKQLTDNQQKVDAEAMQLHAEAMQKNAKNAKEIKEKEIKENTAAGAHDKNKIIEYLRTSTNREFISDEQIVQEADEIKKKYDGSKIGNLKTLCITWAGNIRPWQKQDKKISSYV